jgi:hypothetical protein
VATALTPAIHASFKDAFSSAIIPAFERAIQNLLTQMSLTMNKGLKDYEVQLRSHVTKQVTNQLEPITKELKESINKMSNSNSSKNSVSNDFEKKLANIVRAELRSISTTPTTRTGTRSPTTTTTTAPAKVPTMAEIQAQVRLGSVAGPVIHSTGRSEFDVVLLQKKKKIKFFRKIVFKNC